jgi:hypothetical protein
MSLQKAYPFRRVSVDHMVRGITRVWWQLEPTFNDPGPYVFQLQTSDVGLNDAHNWRTVGAPVTNGVYATDSEKRVAGALLITHYRVTLSTPAGKYVSAPASCWGELDEKDWITAREIIRKELLRHKKVSIGGNLLKIMRYGPPCPRCRELLTQETSDADCPICYGTNYEGGYHPPSPLQCWDLSAQILKEDSDDKLRGSNRENPYVTARVIGYPGLNYRDIWVNDKTDERWRIDDVKITAAIRGVPLVYEVNMGLLPFANVAYTIPLAHEPPPYPAVPVLGSGCVTVTDTYNGDNLSYKTAENEPIADAYVCAFTKKVFDTTKPQFPPRHLAEAITTTDAAGRWTSNMHLNPGLYVLLYEKHHEYGPDTKELTITHASSSSSSAASSVSSSSSSAVGMRKVNTFWEI